MEYCDFQRAALHWKNTLTSDYSSFRELVEQSKSNERTCNAVMFFALTSDNHFSQLMELSSVDPEVRRMFVDLYHTLQNVTLPNNVRPVADMLKSCFFYRKGVSQLLDGYVPSYRTGSMGKYLTSLVREFQLEQTRKKEDPYVDALLAGVTRENLFVEAK